MHQHPWWAVLLLLPFRIALLPFRMLRHVARGASRGVTRSGPPITAGGPGRRRFPGWLFGRWWFWVAFGMFMLVFRSGRDERYRHRPDPENPAPAAAPQQPDAEHLSDNEIEAKVQEALKASPLTRSEEIEVEADEGTVTLRGTVGGALVSQLAQALAEAVPSVHGVHNRLRVQSGHPDGERPEKPELAEGPERPEGPGWPDLRGVPFLSPPEPGSPQAKALAQLLEKADRAMKEGRPEEALGMFGAALALDPQNHAARRGLEQASRQMKRNLPAKPPRHPDAPPTPPS
jgi:hypothetical protein